MSGLAAVLPIFVLIILVLIVIATHVHIVQQSRAYVVEQLGAFHAVWNVGIHFQIPVIMRVAKKISLKEQVADFAPQPVITKDNVTMQIDTVVYFQITDPKLYTYGVEHPMNAIENLTATTLRNIIGDMELDQTLTSRDRINARLETILDEATDAWGIKVTRVELKNIEPPAEIKEVMTKQMKAERERRQTVLEAQAHQEAVVSRAEGDKKARILNAEADKEARIALAEGQARSIEMVYSAEAAGLARLKEAGADAAVLQLKSLEAVKAVADGRATKIFLPAELAKLGTIAGAFSEITGLGTATPVDAAEKPAPAPKEDPCCDDK